MTQPAFPGPYTDPNLTVRDVPHRDIPQVPPITNNFQQVPVYSAEGTQTTGFTHTDAPPVAPNSWRVGRDPYANHGAVGQEFLDNSGG